MAEECVLDPLSFKLKKRYNPIDDIRYIIPSMAIRQTEKILAEYGAFNPANEGMIYWGGTENKNTVTIRAVIAPQTTSGWGRVSTSHRSNFDFVRALNRYGLIQVAQVHSHPSDWVDHSSGDDSLAAFRVERLVSIVVPEYCNQGMMPLMKCGIHRYTQGNFIRLANKYIRDRFAVRNDLRSLLVDFRK